MISRIIISLCSVAASVGLLLAGMATSYAKRDDDMLRLGVILMVGGIVGTAVGIVWYRTEEAAATRKLVAQEARVQR
jgi:uncharacterized membrane protein YfcA